MEEWRDVRPSSIQGEEDKSQNGCPSETAELGVTDNRGIGSTGGKDG